MSDTGKRDKKQEFINSALSDPDTKGFTKKQRIMLHALKLQKGNVSLAAQMLGMSRQTFYNQKNTNVKFNAMCIEIDNVALDFVESKLMERINDGSDTSIIYYLNCKGKSRGYQSINKIDHSTNGKDLPAAPQLIFMSVDDLSSDQVDKLIENQSSNHNFSLPEIHQ